MFWNAQTGQKDEQCHPGAGYPHKTEGLQGANENMGDKQPTKNTLNTVHSLHIDISDISVCKYEHFDMFTFKYSYVHVCVCVSSNMQNMFGCST